MVNADFKSKTRQYLDIFQELLYESCTPLLLSVCSFLSDTPKPFCYKTRSVCDIIFLLLIHHKLIRFPLYLKHIIDDVLIIVKFTLIPKSAWNLSDSSGIHLHIVALQEVPLGGLSNYFILISSASRVMCLLTLVHW